MNEVGFTSLRRLRALQPQFARHGVAHAWLFGSRARGQSDMTSDWDLLVEFQGPPSFDNYMGLKLLLEESLGGGVDLVVRSACKPRFLAAIQQDLQNVA